MYSTEAAKENWVGVIFANNWQIKEKYSCSEYKNLLADIGVLDKQIKNAHYRVFNLSCGVETFMERTTIKRNIDNKTTCLSKCRGCNGDKESCYYKTQLRDKKLTKTPNRNEKFKLNSIFGIWKLLDIKPSENYSDHQKRVVCQCQLCNTIKEFRYDCFENESASCRCMKHHSTGETLIKVYLDKKQYKYKSEYTHSDLIGLNGGFLRYDFAILSENDIPIAFIEFDGQQHFEESGTYYNPSGLVQKHDTIKNEYALSKDIPLLRISYKDIKSIEQILDSFFETFDFYKNF